MFKKGDTAGIVCCSDGMDPKQRTCVEDTEEILRQMGLEILESPWIYQKETLASGTPQQRADALMEMYRNPEVKVIFDISGGNLANEVLDLLDYEVIGKETKEFWGYSDLTVILNAIYTKTGKTSRLYQVRNLAGTYAAEQQARFQNMELFPTQWKFLQGTQMEGVVLGGNIRCFLKLAGTEYFPDLENKLLFLESRSGGVGLMTAMLTQLRQMGVFKKIRGLLLGTFTQLDTQEGYERIEKLAAEQVQNPELPIARTLQVGHGQDSRALLIGSPITVKSI